MSGSEPFVLDRIKDFLGGTVIKTITEIYTLMPDSLLFGSLLLYFLTQNLSYGIFCIFIFETVITHKMISWVAGQTVGPTKLDQVSCLAGYKTARIAVERMFSHDPYPSYGTFSITAIATYLGLSMKEFDPTMQKMDDPSWKTRSLIAYIGIASLLFVFIMARLWKCDGFGEVFIAVVLAILTGAIFFTLNKSLFGMEAMNFLGLPYMIPKESTGSPIYVCAADAPSS